MVSDDVWVDYRENDARTIQAVQASSHTAFSSVCVSAFALVAIATAATASAALPLSVLQVRCHGQQSARVLFRQSKEKVKGESQSSRLAHSFLFDIDESTIIKIDSGIIDGATNAPEGVGKPDQTSSTRPG